MTPPSVEMLLERVKHREARLRTLADDPYANGTETADADLLCDLAATLAQQQARIAELEQQHAELAERFERKVLSHEHTKQFYAERLEWLEQWFRT